MSKKLIKTGSSSILLGIDHYGGYFPIKTNKLIKVTKIRNNHNEFKNLSLIRKIRNYEKYFTIPDEEFFEIDYNNAFYQKLIKIVSENDKDFKIFDSILTCNYIDYAGDFDLTDSINSMYEINDKRVWNSTKSILNFSKQIMTGLSYLHQNKICHLDIKFENIMINIHNKSFKIIDFGFSSVEPFDDFVNNLKGTPGYFPVNSLNKPSQAFPRINANDMIMINYELPFKKNRKLVYKIDSYCFGRLLYALKYYYNDITTSLSCGIFCQGNNSKKLNNLISLLLNYDINKRLTITEILNLNII